MEIIGFKTLVLVNFLYLTCRKPRKHQSPNKTIFNNPAPAGPGSDSRTHTKAKDTIFKNVEKKLMEKIMRPHSEKTDFAFEGFIWFHTSQKNRDMIITSQVPTVKLIITWSFNTIWSLPRPWLLIHVFRRVRFLLLLRNIFRHVFIETTIHELHPTQKHTENTRPWIKLYCRRSEITTRTNEGGAVRQWLTCLTCGHRMSPDEATRTGNNSAKQKCWQLKVVQVPELNLMSFYLYVCVHLVQVCRVLFKFLQLIQDIFFKVF